MAAYGKRDNIEREIMFAKRVLEDIRTYEVPKLVYEEEKDVVRKALEAYVADKTSQLY